MARIPIERSFGFTLVELVIGLAVIAGLAALAIPSWFHFMAEQALAADARKLADAIMLARSEAIRRNGFVVLCAVSRTEPCGEVDHWHEGWVMFHDRDGNAEEDADDHALGRELPASTGVSIVGNSPVQTYLRFNHTGMARTVTGALQMGTFVVCRPGFRGYRVVLANAGRTRIERGPACAA